MDDMTRIGSRLSVLVAFLLIVGLTSRAAQAQGSEPPDSLAWERVGTLNNAWGLYFDADTLYAAFISQRFQVLRPGDEDFSDAFLTSFAGTDLIITPDRVVFFRRAASSLFRTADWGLTGGAVHDDAFSLPVVTPEGAFALGTNIAAVVAGRSEDNGATWTDQEFADGSGAEGGALGSTAILVIPPSPSFPGGRLVATGFGGIAYSDDDGRTWYPTTLYGDLAFVAWGSARLTGGQYDGQLLAVVEGEGGFFYTSTDGAEWNAVADVPTANRHGTRLAPVPGGGVYAYDTVPAGAPVWYSENGGATWEDVGPVWTAWPATVEEIVVGLDGRLYAACSGTFAGHDGGVFRTVEPVIVVAADYAIKMRPLVSPCAPGAYAVRAGSRTQLIAIH